MDYERLVSYINRIPELDLRNIVIEAAKRPEDLEDLIVDYIFINCSEERKFLKEESVKDLLSSALDAFDCFDYDDEEYEDYIFPYTDVYDPWEELASVLSIDSELISPKLKREVCRRLFLSYLAKRLSEA